MVFPLAGREGATPFCIPPSKLGKTYKQQVKTMDDSVYTMGKELDLKAEQEHTLATPVMRSNLILKILIVTLDLFYGKKRTLPKFKVLEILARYPYWAWEDGAYRRLSKDHAAYKQPADNRTRRFLGWIDLGRESQDNEQWHMLLLEEIIEKKGIKTSPLLHRWLPLAMALVYYHLTRLMFFVYPHSSFYMNAAFESHAEHQYMLMAKEHPEWDEEPVESKYFEHYPRQKTLGDLIRRIGLDERDHMHHSIAEMDRLEGRVEG